MNINQKIANLSAEKRALLELKLKKNKNKNTNTSKYQTISPRENRNSALLSFAQQRLWFLDQLEPNSTVYHISRALRLSGELNIQVLKQALDAIVTHHEVLRTNYIAENGNPIQVIAAPQSVELPIIDLQQYGQAEQETQIQKLLTQERQRPFNLSSDIMLRGCLLKLAPQGHILLLIMHHIASDGWSMGILWQQLTQLYQAFLDGQPNPLEPLPIQYADYAVWQREWLTGEVLDKKLNYWKQQLAGSNPVLELPIDRSRPPVQTYRGARQSLTLPPSLSDGLKQLCRQQGVTLYMTLLAVFATLVHRYTGQEDILIGSPVACRNRAEIEGLIGFFINTVVLRANFSQEPSFRSLLAQVREVALGAYAHQDMPFEKLVEELILERDTSRNPLFQVLFNMINLEDIQLRMPGIDVESISNGEVASKLDLTLYVAEQEDGVKLRLVYNADLFNPERMQVFLNQYHHLLEQIVANPDKPISAYSLITSSSKLLLSDPSVVLPEPEYELVPTMFTSWAQRTPEKIAICQEKNTWSYGDLSQTAQILAKVLLAQGIDRGDVVAVSGTRSFGIIASMLGVLLSGGVLLNIDPKLPKHRQQIMLEQAQAKCILYVGIQLPDDNSIWDSLDNICVEPETGAAITAQTDNFSATHLPEIAADDAAYIFFTSGTTGVPKGVLGCHKGLSHFLTWQRQTFEIGSQDRIAQLTALSFDVVLRDIFLPLISGATLCLPKEEDILEPTRILSWLERERISVFHTVPTLGQSWLTNVPAGVSLGTLRWLFFAGEPLKGTLVQQWRETFPQSGEIVNLYGPTETTLAKCCYRVPNEITSGIQSVGWPLPETQALVLGPNAQLCGIGEEGEIVIRTPFRSLGYINAPEEKLSRFVKNPFGNAQQDVLYYTGDRGRYNPDGSLEILGRLDHQVKIRGVRIELGEIEAVLSQHPDLLQSVVIVREDVTTGDKQLVAYIVANTETALTNSEIRQFLRNQLPEYMIPCVFVFLDTMPLTPNGKVDRRALPVPDKIRQEPSTLFVAPQDQLESHLAKIWEQVLGVQPIGVRDNFFDMGGNSLKAVTLFAQIEKQFGKNLPLVTLFQSGTVAELAQIIRQKEWLAPWESLVAIQPNGNKPPLFYIHPGGGNLLVYRDLALALGSGQPVYGLQPRGLDGKLAPLNRIEDMAAHYLAQIRKIQPNGPYYLGGLSTGGTIAWEIAQRIQTQGKKVALLALFDTSGPEYPKLLPPLPRLLSVLNWVVFDLLRRAIKLPLKLVRTLKELGIKQFSIKILKRLGIVENVSDKDTKILKELRNTKFRKKLARYKSRIKNISTLEKWVNSMVIILLRNSSKPYYCNLLVGAMSWSVNNLPESLQKVRKANMKASRKYIPKVYPGRFIFFRASKRPPGIYKDPDVGWGDMAAGGMEIYEIPGTHTSIINSPVLAKKLKICLEKAQANTDLNCVRDR